MAQHNNSNAADGQKLLVLSLKLSASADLSCYATSIDIQCDLSYLLLE
jgi:hypothetical protein